MHESGKHLVNPLLKLERVIFNKSRLEKTSKFLMKMEFAVNKIDNKKEMLFNAFTAFLNNL